MKPATKKKKKISFSKFFFFSNPFYLTCGKPFSTQWPLNNISSHTDTVNLKINQFLYLTLAIMILMYFNCHLMESSSWAPGEVESHQPELLHIHPFTDWNSQSNFKQVKKTLNFSLTSCRCVTSREMQTLYILCLYRLYPHSTLCVLQMSSLPPQNFFEIHFQPLLWSRVMK